MFFLLWAVHKIHSPFSCNFHMYIKFIISVIYKRTRRKREWKGHIAKTSWAFKIQNRIEELTSKFALIKTICIVNLSRSLKIEHVKEWNEGKNSVADLDHSGSIHLSFFKKFYRLSFDVCSANFLNFHTSCFQRILNGLDVRKNIRMSVFVFFSYFLLF